MAASDLETADRDALPASNARPKELVIRPVRAFTWDDLLDVWRYRDLLWTLGMRDVRVRYKQAGFGAAWAIVQPLTQAVIFTVLFSRFVGIRPDADVPYPVFCFAGLVVWMLFSSSLAHASESLVQSADLVTKVYFPRVVLPVAATLSAAVDFAIGFVLLIAGMAIYGVRFHPSLILAVPIALLAALCAVSVGLWTSAINLQFRDVRYALPFFFQILVYVTPVFYPSTVVPERYRFILDLNPMAAVVDAFRGALFGTPLPWSRVGMAFVSALVVGALGFAYFRRMEQTFADRI